MKRSLIIGIVFAFIIGAAIPFHRRLLRAYAELQVWHHQVEMQIQQEAIRRQYGEPPPTFTLEDLNW